MIATVGQSTSNKSYCLTFDGKKMKRGLTSISGDVNLLGFEHGHSLTERQKQLEDLKKPIQEMMNVFLEVDESQNMNTIINDVERKEQVDKLFFQRKTISLNILNARELRKKKEYARQKLIERGGGSDWKNGKYVFAISSMIAFVHDIDEYLQQSMALVDEITTCICCLKLSGTSTLITQDVMDLDKSPNYRKIEHSGNPTSRQVKQRSLEWFEQRSKARIAGSTMYVALGLDGLAKQKDHFVVTVGGLHERTKPETVKAVMEHGTLNEIHAAATMVGKVLPMICPEQKVFEEGYISMDSTKSKSFMVVSPDGSVRIDDNEETTIFAIEYKCPIYDVQHHFPARYLLQCLSEIKFLNVESLIYLCWRPDLSTVFKVNRNSMLFKKAFDLAVNMYDVEKPKRPTKLADETNVLKTEINELSRTNSTVEFIGVFRSLTHNYSANNIHDAGKFILRRFDLMLTEMLSNYEKYYGLQRIPATEAVVFLCCDLDRIWGKETVHSVPVCWFPKGSSLDTCTMRNISESVLNTCAEAGIHIPAVSFDGQGHNIAVRDVNEKPLTLLQLQKDVWKTVERMPKNDVLKSIASKNKVVKRLVHTWFDDEGSVKHAIICTNGGIVLPKVSESVSLQRVKARKQIAYTSNMPDEQLQIAENNFVEPDEQPFENNKRIELDDGTVNSDSVDTEAMGKLIIETQKHQAKRISLTEVDKASILTQFKVDKYCNAKGQWDDSSLNSLSVYFQSEQTLRKFRDTELRVIVRYINRNYNMKIKESEKKEAKLQTLCNLLSLEYSSDQSHHNSKRSKIQQPKRLAEQAFKIVSNRLKKSDLNIIYSEYIWPQELQMRNTVHNTSCIGLQEEEQFVLQ
ncbi:hypothetical protein DPMN_012957 [Dreissena polymorpha]|uniref:YqaJ viral recombinase domain-containing protein n=1 Tax=Dreissena polymorpha TaxID=45954 RepID=A0A9D4N905_DREPO|nr:hypothetical protein DPMN_012957 [Dreissena polymorpha]